MGEKKYTVYCHKTPSGKRYFGITGKKVSERWAYGRGYETCSAFKKAIDKYGWDNIEHIVLYEDLTKEEAESIERTLIAEYKTTDKNHGYNILPYGNIAKCKDVPKEVRDRATVERTKVGREQTPESIAKALETKVKVGIIKPILCYETGVIYPSLSEAARQMGLTGCTPIILAIRNPSHTAAGYHWCYLEDAESFEPEINRAYRPVINIDTGKKYISINEAARDTGVNAAGIVLTCEGKRRRSGGYAFCYEEEYGTFVPMKKYKRRKPVRNKKTGEEFASATEAARKYGYSDTSIARVCKGIRKTVHGDVWEYVDLKDADVNTGISHKPIQNAGIPRAVINVETLERYESVSEAAKATGIQRRNIGKCCVNHHYTAGGFHWRYAEEVME